MTEQADDETSNDEEVPARGGLTVGRRNALKGGAVGLAALGLGAIGTGTVAGDHDPANKVAAAGSDTKIAEVAKNNSDNISTFHTFLGPFEMKTSGDEKQSLVFQPTIESSLFTDVKVKGNDTASTAKAGVLGWIELKGDTTGDVWQMVTAEGNYVDPPSDPSALADAFETLDGDNDWPVRGVVGFNTRDFKLETDLTKETDGDLLALYLRTRSANAFTWIARPVNGTNTVRLRGALYVYVDDDKAQAQAMVGNRTMYVEPTKLHHDVQ